MLFKTRTQCKKEWHVKVSKGQCIGISVFIGRTRGYETLFGDGVEWLLFLFLYDIVKREATGRASTRRMRNVCASMLLRCCPITPFATMRRSRNELNHDPGKSDMHAG